MTREEFVKEFYPKAKPICAKNGISTVGCLAQCAQETGWGEFHKDNIYFGIKPWKKSQDAAEHNTKEVIEGQEVKVKDKFVKWTSFEDAVTGYCAFLKENSRYKEALKRANSWRAYLPEIAKAGYATDPNYLANCLLHGKQIERLIYSLGLEA